MDIDRVGKARHGTVAVGTTDPGYWSGEGEGEVDVDVWIEVWDRWDKDYRVGVDYVNRSEKGSAG